VLEVDQKNYQAMYGTIEKDADGAHLCSCSCNCSCHCRCGVYDEGGQQSDIEW